MGSGSAGWPGRGQEMPRVHAGGIFLPPYFCHRAWTTLEAVAWFDARFLCAFAGPRVGIEWSIRGGAGSEPAVFSTCGRREGGRLGEPGPTGPLRFPCGRCEDGTRWAEKNEKKRKAQAAGRSARAPDARTMGTGLRKGRRAGVPSPRWSGGVIRRVEVSGRAGTPACRLRRMEDAGKSARAPRNKAAPRQKLNVFVRMNWRGSW
jgi:hypothetical protein